MPVILVSSRKLRDTFHLIPLLAAVATLSALTLSWGQTPAAAPALSRLFSAARTSSPHAAAASARTEASPQAAATTCSYALSAAAASLDAAAVSGSVTLTTSNGCAWNAASDSAWLTVTDGASGTASGDVGFSVTANAGAARTGTLTIGGQSLTVTQLSATTDLALAGSFPQVASAGGWSTTLSLVNLGSTAATSRLNFYANDGTAQLLPFTFPQQSSPTATLADAMENSLAPGATLLLNTTGTDSDTGTRGFAALRSSSGIDGFAIFKYSSTNQQAAVPLETRSASSYLLAFDDTGSLATGLAVANLASSAASIPVIVRDDTGAQIGTGTISLPASGHNSFMLSDATYGFPAAAGKRGTLEFDTPAGGRISVLGLRANGDAVTTLPVMANAATGGGSFAHIAAGAGWQSTITLVNSGATPASVTLSFFDGNGAPLSLPLSLPQTSGTATASTLTQTLAAGATLIVATNNASASAAITGSAALTTTGNVGGFTIFRYAPTGQEAVVPLETRSAAAFLLAFDNTGSLATGIAVANTGTTAVSVPVTVRDDTGATLTSTTLALPAQGHASFMLTDPQQGFPATAGKRGVVEFDTPASGSIAALGIRADAPVITTIPALAKAGATNSSTALTVSPATAAPGALVMLSAAVSPASATGTVTFYDGTTAIGSAVLASGTATLGTHFNTTGAYTLTAVYNGDATYAASTASAQAATVESATYALDLSTYTATTGSMTVTTDASHTVAYKLYQNVVYVSNPVDKTYESMNIYIPTTVDGTAVSTRPVLLDIGVGGYMSNSVWVGSSSTGPTGPGGPGGPGGGTLSTNGEYALARGYVVVEVGCRGRDNVSNGTYYGKAPAALVDLKAAVRFLRYSASAGTFPGNVNYIIDSGGSAGGALASLLGASANSPLYSSYLAAIGAADAADNIFAVAAYSPITNLDNADGAYEWEYGTASYNGAEVDQTVSAKLKSIFQTYQNSLALTGDNGYGTLTASNIDDYILKTYLEPSASKYLSSLSATALSTYLASHTWISWNSATSTATFAFADYVSYIGRGKSVPAFDAFFDLTTSSSTVNTSTTPEVSEFGTASADARHFTNFSSEFVDGTTISADEQTIVNMMNPMYFIGLANSSIAPYWLIRDGSIATDTSAMVIIDLATSLENLLGSSHVNAWEYWDGGHAVNDDPAVLFAWLDTLTGSASSSTPSSGLTATTTALTTSATSAATGSSVTLSATVAPAAAGGTVTFYSGTTALGSATLNSGTAALTTSFSSAGTYALTAAYGGSSTYSASTSSAVSLTVSAAASSSSIAMVSVPGGTFFDGVADMTVSNFQMGKYPVTQAQYQAVMGSNPSSFSGSTNPADTVNWYEAIYFCNKLSIAEGLTPVYSISGSTDPTVWGTPSTNGANFTWDAATINTSANGYRLPTSAEWLWAAMGGASDAVAGDVVNGVNVGGYTKGYAGSAEANGAQTNIGAYCWYSGNSGSTTHPVGTKLPNELGLYDLCGNVSQWTWDYYWGENVNDPSSPLGAAGFPTTNQTNYTGTATGKWRWLLGGSWTDPASALVVLSQDQSFNPSVAHNYTGFRVVRGTH